MAYVFRFSNSIGHLNAGNRLVQGCRDRYNIGTTPAQIGKLESFASSPGPPVRLFAEASVMGNASTVVALRSLRVTALR